MTSDNSNDEGEDDTSSSEVEPVVGDHGGDGPDEGTGVEGADDGETGDEEGAEDDEGERDDDWAANDDVEGLSSDDGSVGPGADDPGDSDDTATQDSTGVTPMDEVTGSGSGDAGERPGGTTGTSGGSGREVEMDADIGGETESESGPASDDGGGTTSDGPSEEELEREILDPEERMGPGEQFCQNCGEVIDEKAEVCPECGVRQEDAGRQAGSGVGSATGTSASGSDEADPTVGALLSLLIPGVGHMINGQMERGAIVLGGTLLSYVLLSLIAVVLFAAGSVIVGFITAITFGLGAILGVLLPLAGVVPLLGLVAHPVAAWDAYNQAEKINRGEVVLD